MTTWHKPSLPRPMGGILLAAVLLAVVDPAPARADSDEDAPVFAVQNRKFNLRHEFDVGVGVLPINAFTKGLTASAAYTFHFSPLWAWEIARVAYSFGLATGLREELITVGAADATRKLDFINYFASSTLLLKPLYGKLAFTNRRVVHVEAFFALGAAVAGFTNVADSPGLIASTSGGALRAGFDAGGGFRFFLDENFSLRFDIRDLTFFTSGGSTASELYLGLALALTFGNGGR